MAERYEPCSPRRLVRKDEEGRTRKPRLLRKEDRRGADSHRVTTPTSRPTGLAHPSYLAVLSMSPCDLRCYVRAVAH